MSSKSNRPSVFNIAAIADAEGAPPEADGGEVKATKAPAKGDELFRTSCYMPKAVHLKLEEIAFHEGRKKVNDLIIEGLDAVLTKRGYGTTTELKNGAKAS